MKKFIEALSYKDITQRIKLEKIKVQDYNPDISNILSHFFLMKAQKYNSSDLMLLENLTGLNLSTEEKLYDYFKAGIKFTEKDTLRFGVELSLELVQDLKEI